MLDNLSLEAIALEARNCFLYEDAPEYLKMLTEGIEKLRNEFSNQKNTSDCAKIYQDLARAAHSIKGGAGMAEMQIVSKLAHKIEDVFEALEGNRIQDSQTALQLLNLGIEELDDLIEAEVDNRQLKEESSSLELIAALDEFLTTIDNPEKSAEIGFANDDFIATALTVDLDACIQRVEEILLDDSQDKIKHVTESLSILQEECTLLGQALNCTWLVEFSYQINKLKDSKQLSILELVPLAIAELKHLRTQFLQKTDEKPEFSQNFSELLPQEKKEETETVKEDKKEIQSANLRIPVTKITKIGDNISDLLIHYERLKLHENQLKQASLNLKKRTKALFPLREQVESIYDHLTVTNTNKDDEKINNNGYQKDEIIDVKEFDSLEFDEYNQVHNVLQNLSELMIQVEEVREDVDILNREFQETLITMGQSFQNLEQDLTQIKLVPFINLAGSFLNPLEKLNKKYNKSVELIIEGKQVLIDQEIIEKLRTPFNHIIRNAFDHGIESPKHRKKADKPKQGKVKLAAKLQGNNVIIIISDDGAGIDINKVFKKAVNLGLFPENIAREKLTEKQILDLIFSPGFSTAKKVSDLSGRGIGMDIVKAEIEKLRGTIQVKTEQGKGTQFTLNIPLALNIMPLLLIKIQQQTLAIPSDQVLRIIRLSDYEIKDNQILWENQLISVNCLYKLLPYQNNRIFNYIPENSYPNIALLLSIGYEKRFLAIDEILDEKELVTKAFDDTVPVPAYISGCTILGSGQVVPILVPDYLKQLLNTFDFQPIVNKSENESKTLPLNEQTSILVIDDSMAVRRTLDRILTKSGYQVVKCRDGKEAFHVLQKTNQKFDLALCDLEMPNMDGYKLLQMIRASSTWQNLPVIILTSRESNLHKEKAMNLGATAYMTKPFHPVKILEVIETCLN